MEGLEVSSSISIFSVFLYFFAHECFYVMKNTPKKVQNKTSSDNLDRRVLSQYNPPGNDRSSLDNILPAKISNFKREKRSLVVTLSLRDLKSFFYAKGNRNRVENNKKCFLYYLCLKCFCLIAVQIMELYLIQNGPKN